MGIFSSRDILKVFSSIRRNYDHSVELNLLTGYLTELGILEYVETEDGPTAKTPTLITHSESIILMNKNNNEIYADPFIKINLEINRSLKKDSKYKITELKKCLIMR